jgi:hypothetical protein
VIEMEMLLIGVSLVSLAIATGMSVVAWRLVREGRLRSAARVEALETLAFAAEPWEGPALENDAMFGAAAEHAAPSRRWLALAAVAGMMALGAGTVYALRPSAAESGTSALVATSPAVTPLARPLELTSLQHSTDEPGYFTVTGLVHNPASAQSLRGVVAVVYLFDAQGRYIANARGPVDLAALDPGVEATFTVRIPVTGVVARYRVGFRMADGSVVPHVDRRAEPTADSPGRQKTEGDRVGL